MAHLLYVHFIMYKKTLLVLYISEAPTSYVSKNVGQDKWANKLLTLIHMYYEGRNR